MEAVWEFEGVVSVGSYQTRSGCVCGKPWLYGRIWIVSGPRMAFLALEIYAFKYELDGLDTAVGLKFAAPGSLKI